VGSEKVLEKRFAVLESPGKVLEFFVIKSVGTLDSAIIALFDIKMFFSI